MWLKCLVVISGTISFSGFLFAVFYVFTQTLDQDAYCAYLPESEPIMAYARAHRRLKDVDSGHSWCAEYFLSSSLADIAPFPSEFCLCEFYLTGSKESSY